MYTLTDTPDDELEKHVESLKVFYASRKVWCVWWVCGGCGVGVVGVSWVCLGCVVGVSWVCGGCVLGVWWVCLGCVVVRPACTLTWPCAA